MCITRTTRKNKVGWIEQLKNTDGTASWKPPKKEMMSRKTDWSVRFCKSDEVGWEGKGHDHLRSRGLFVKSWKWLFKLRALEKDNGDMEWKLFSQETWIQRKDCRRKGSVRYRHFVRLRQEMCKYAYNIPIKKLVYYMSRQFTGKQI